MGKTCNNCIFFNGRGYCYLETHPLKKDNEEILNGCNDYELDGKIVFK